MLPDDDRGQRGCLLLLVLVRYGRRRLWGRGRPTITLLTPARIPCTLSVSDLEVV
jgi:hypothetical protein